MSQCYFSSFPNSVLTQDYCFVIFSFLDVAAELNEDQWDLEGRGEEASPLLRIYLLAQFPVFNEHSGKPKN